MALGTELDRSTLRSLGGVDARGLMRRLQLRHEGVPIGHAFALVVSAAARVHAVHSGGGRIPPTAENILIRYDGSVELRGTRTTIGDRRNDVTLLGRLLVELLASAELPGDLAATLAAIIDPDRGAATAEELARALAQAARNADIQMSKTGLGRFARHVVYPHGTANTPAFGVGTGSHDSSPTSTDSAAASGTLAGGSVSLHEDDLAEVSAVIDVDRMIGQATAPAAATSAPASAIASTPRLARGSAPIHQSQHRMLPERSLAAGLVEALVILLVIAVVGLALQQVFPGIAADVGGLLAR